MLFGQAIDPSDRRVQQLGIRREGDRFGLHGGIDRDAGQVLAAQRAAFMRYPQTLGQQQLQFVAQAFAPMAQVGTLVWKLVLEELFPGEVLKIGIVDPTLADAFVGQSVNVLEQQQSDHEAGLDTRPSLVAVERSDLTIQPRPVDLAGELNQLMLHVDDLLQPCPEQIT